MNVIYALLIEGADTKARAKLDRALEAPPEGEMERLWADVGDMDELRAARERLRALRSGSPA